jgi:type I restriction enzyme S subunit
MKYGLTEKAVEKICAVFARFPAIEKAVLYGSRAKGNFKTGSDIDLTLYGEALTADLRSAIASALDDLLLPYTIDLSIFDELNHAKLREHIERVGVLFYERANQGAAMKSGWPTKTLGEACKIKPPKSEAREQLAADALVSFLPMEDMGINEKFVKATQKKPLSKVQGSYTYFADGDVLLAKITPCFENGKLGIAQDLTNGIGFGSSEYIVFRPDKTISKEWLYYYLSRETFRVEGAARMSGAVGHKRVSKEFIENYPIPVPPLAEQQRIVGILDEAFAGIAAAKANAEKNLQNARALFDSHLQSVFTQRGEGWVEKPFSELCDIKHGFAFKSEFFASEGDYVLLTPGNFYESGGYRDRGEKQKYYTGEIPSDYILSEGDLLVAMTEQAAGLLGSPIIVPESDKFLHNQRLGLVTEKPGVAWTNEFFFHVFNTQSVRKQIHDNASGVKVRHTSPTKIGEVVVSFPTSLLEQREIVSKLKDLREETQRLASLYERTLAVLEALKKSLLHQAFTGEL